MHRSGSTSRASDEFSVNISPPLKGSPGLKTTEMDQLPTYNPQSDVAKKEMLRLKSSETAVHFIPLVLILCALILWVFSHPAVDILNKGDSIAVRAEGMMIDGYSNKTSFPMDTEPEELDLPKQTEDLVPGKRSLENVT
ncbi:uncharacterized protein LOC143891718 [Tasmannia lanceolata]|uniref:uncharacterized protein LOC143891718 n=1 Tax=Tasmannia lanceolata TaxID=3420 RepID=UPI004062B19A